MILVTKWFGVFLCDGNKIVDKHLMPKDPEQIAAKMVLVQSGSVLPEETELARGRVKLRVSERRQDPLGKPTMFDSSFIKPDAYGFSDEMMRSAMLILGKLRISEPIPRDKNLVQAIRNLDNIIESANLMNERLHEWYGLHFPELADLAKDKRYAELVSRYGDRNAVCEHLGLEIESVGAELDPDDMRAVMNLAETLCMIYDDRDRTEGYISGIVENVCPNMCAILGGPLSGRLISLAGGLERLSSLPSSTIQLLGAEKAMFRHLRSGKKPPKHGVIFQHPDVHRAPYWQRGNIARALAGKVLIAAKVDCYGGDFSGDALNEQFKRRVEEIKGKYPDPPKPKKVNKKNNRRR